jgi:Ca2+/Na+ antiporter
MLGASLLLFIFLFTGKKQRLNRPESATFLAIFVCYMAYIIYRG